MKSPQTLVPLIEGLLFFLLPTEFEEPRELSFEPPCVFLHHYRISYTKKSIARGKTKKKKSITLSERT